MKYFKKTHIFPEMDHNPEEEEDYSHAKAQDDTKAYPQANYGH